MTASGATTELRGGDGSLEVHVLIRGESGLTFLTLHGRDGAANDFLMFPKNFDWDATILQPRGPVLGGGLHRRTTEVGAFVRAAAAAYGLDPKRIVAVGESNGANVAAALLQRDGDALAGAVLLWPTPPFELGSVPKLGGKAIYLVTVRGDRNASSVQHLVDFLRSGGATVEVASTDAADALEVHELNAAIRWFERQRF